jgi:hypothetical protein
VSNNDSNNAPERLRYVFEMITRGDGLSRKGQSHPRTDVVVELDRPDNWPVASRAQRRALEREALSLAQPGPGCMIGNFMRPPCECLAPTLGANGTCGNCGGIDGPCHGCARTCGVDCPRM